MNRKGRGRENRTRKQRRKIKKQESNNGLPRQRQITEFGVRTYSEDEGLGDHIDTVKEGSDLRVYLQNPDGVMAEGKDLDDRRALLELKSWDVDIVALPETNRNWRQEWIRNQWKREVNRIWPHAKVFNASIDKPAHAHARYVSGGVSLIVTDCWASRVMAHGSDHLGRWVWVTLRGRKQERLTVAAMYRPNPGYLTDGPTTVWAQQRARLQEVALESGKVSEVDPREKCLIDLNEWVKQRRSGGEKVIILTDANQTLQEQTKAFSLRDLAEECQMRSVMEDRYPGQTLRSLDRGSKTIDHILTAGLDHGCVRRRGQLPFGLGFSSDHRGMYADIDANIVLQLYMDEPERREGRRLSSKNGKHRDNYIKAVIASLESQNVFKRVGELARRAQNGELLKQDQQEYDKLDDSITTAMLAAEKKLPRKGSRVWTTELGRLIHQARYYRILLRKAKGLAYHQGILRKVKQQANIDGDITDIADIQRRLRATWTNINKIRKNEKEAREKHLESLVNAADGNTKEAIQQIKYREQTRWRFRKIRNTLNRIHAGGLAGVDVPLYGDDGAIQGWKSVTERNELHRVLVDRNLEHLHQASTTPIGHGEGYDLFHGPSRHETAKAVLEGRLEWSHPVEEVNLFVSNMAKAYDPKQLAEEVERINKDITAEEFRAYFKGKDESTESSPSGRHVGHYKAALASDDLVDVLVSMLNVGLTTGHALDRWKKTVSIMLEKDAGQPKLHRLRIIQLFEADYNFLLSLVFGHRLMTFARKHCKMNESQYGSMGGKQAQSAVLNKILTYDLIRLTKQDAATSEFDAAANYDRILPALAMIACQRLGLAEKPAELLYNSLVDLKHQVKTIYGLLAEYGSTRLHPLHGTGQGSGGSPTFWAVIADVLFNSMDSQGKGLVFNNPRRDVVSARNEDGYVDDTALGVDGRDGKVTARITTAAQRHERILYATGGKLALHKCAWVLMTWIWREGEAILQTHPEEADGTCTAASSEQLKVEQSESGAWVVIPRLNPTRGYRTLGIWIAADGNQNAQLERMQTLVSVWLDNIAASSLSAQDKYLAYTSFLRPQLVFPIGCSTIERKTLKKLFRPVLDRIMHTQGLNKNFPLALVHAGPEWMGLGIDDLPTLQGVAQLQLLLGHLNKQDRTGQLIKIERDYLELVIGMGVCPLQEPHTALLEHVPRTWITSTCNFLHNINSNVEVRHERVVAVQREQDRYIMQLALDGRYKLRLIQQCRLYLKAVTLADVFNAAGDQLELWAFRGPARDSQLSWPVQGQPSKQAWVEWRKFLRSMLSTYGLMVGKYLKPAYKLGKWYSTHQQWQWRGNSRYVIHDDGRRYWRDGLTLVEMESSMQLVETLTYPVQVHRRGRSMLVRDVGGATPVVGNDLDIYGRLRGEVYPQVTSPKFTDVDDDIVVATDGSLKDGRGSAAYIINSLSTPGTIKSVLPVDGSGRQMTSYRTELVGMLGALLALTVMLQEQKRSWKHLSGTLWCDNKSAVTKFNQLEDKVPFSLTMANETDADVLQELRILKHKLPVPIHAAWVKGHQTQCSSREARLNAIADHLANTQHGKTGQWATKVESAMLPGTQAQLVVAGKRYTGPINRKLQYHMHDDKAKNYVINKLNLNGKEHLVDWKALGALHRRLSLRRRVTRLKFIFRWAPTNARQHLVGTSDTTLCPLCTTENETQNHVFCCTSTQAVVAREGALRQLEEELVRAKTHPDITTLILMAVKGENEGLRDLVLSKEDDVAEAAKQQENIGWHLVLFGVVSKEWSTVQANWSKRVNSYGAGSDSKKWAKTLQDALWAFVQEIWEHRNKKVHGDTEEEVRQIKTTKLRQECVSLAGQGRPVGEADQHLLKMRLDNKGCMFLYHWRRLVRNAISKEAARNKRRVRMQAAELFRQVRLRQVLGSTMRQSSMDEFVVSKDASVTGVSEPGELDTVPWLGLQNIRVLAQRELALREDAQHNETEE